jgi:hypothetical protein
MLTKYIKVLCILLSLLGFLLPGTVQAFVGVVKTVAGEAFVKRQNEKFDVVAGMEIQTADILITGPSGYVGLVFSDDTLISMGPRTEITIDDYLFEPREKKLSFILRLVRGTVSYISGQMAKLSPESVQLIMPAATIGVRGTQVLMKAN